MSPPRRILLLVIIINFNGATSLSLECLNTPGDNFLVRSARTFGGHHESEVCTKFVSVPVR